MRQRGFTVYVLAAAAVAVLVSGIYAVAMHYKAERTVAELDAYRAKAEAEAAKLQAKAAEVKERVVIEYRDRIKTVRVPEPFEVVREIEVIRESGCTLPPEFRVLHDGAATGNEPQASGGVDAAAEVSCAVAIEIVRENYKRSRENAAQLEALQKWAAGVSS